jgi:hypothetical protein
MWWLVVFVVNSVGCGVFWMGLWGVVSGEGKEGEWENGKVKGFLSEDCP